MEAAVAFHWHGRCIASGAQEPSPNRIQFAEERLMTDIFSKDRLGSDRRHRADEIHAHQKKWSAGPLIGLGVLALGLLALWGHARTTSGLAAASCGQTTARFEQYSAALTATSKAELAKFAQCLRAHPSEAVSLEGRADPNELTYDPSLSSGRARALASELGALGVPAAQFAVVSNPTPCPETGTTCQTAAAIPRPARR
jgi:outer membrane protein OmpA-like peptidoglycan-associated protein